MSYSPVDFFPPGVPPAGGAATDQTARDAAAAANATAQAANTAAQQANTAVAGLTPRVGANEASLAVIAETPSALAFATTPPAAGDPYAEVNSTISNLSTRITTSILAGALQLAQIYASALGYGVQHKTTAIAANTVYEAEFSASALSVQTGYFIAINPTSTFDATHGRMIGVRSNGAWITYFGDAATSTATGVTIAGSSAMPYAVGDVVILRLVTGDDPTTATLYGFVNGELLSSATVTGIPAGLAGAMVRQFGPATQGTATIRRFRTHPVAADMTRWRTINIAGTGSDLGTESNPFLTLQSAVRDFSDKPGRSAKLTLKGGAYRFPIVVGLKKYRELTIRAEKGADPIIHGSTLLSTGWTKTAGATNVYQRILVADGVTGALSGVGGIVDLGTPTDLSANDVLVGQSATPRAGQTMPWTIYARLAPATSPATLATQLAACDAQAGSMFVDLSTGIMYVHGLAHADPNTLQLERCDRTSAMRVAWAAAGDWNDCRVNLVGLHFRFAYNHVLWLQRAQVLIEEVIAEGSSVGNACNLDQCGGQVNAGEYRYCYNDGLHFDSPDIPGTVNKPAVHLWGPHCHRNLVGDGISNHELTRVVGQGVRANYNGKDGFAQVDDTRLVGCEMIGNTQVGYGTVSQSVVQTTVHNLTNCVVAGSPIGVDSGATTAGCAAQVTMRGGIMRDTAGHAAPGANKAAVIDAGDVGASTLVLDHVEDGGNNGSVGTTRVTVYGRPGHLGVDRTAPAAGIASLANIVNTRAKVAGRSIRETDGGRRLLTADGPLAADPWRTADGATVVTPA